MEPVYTVLVIINVIAACFIFREVNTMHRKLDDFIESFDTPYNQEGEEEDSNFPPLPKA